MTRILTLALACFLALAELPGCSGPDEPDASTTAVTPAFDGTVGSLCELTGYSAIRVQGFALVVGLPQTGSAECPTPVREHLTGHLRKLDRQNRLPARYAGLNADRIIADQSTAVVLVQGLVPAGAPKGEKFDLEVAALDDTQTTSLQGGSLLPIELRLIAAGQGTRPRAGRPTANGEGPLFVNPFPICVRGDRQQVDPRRGVVLGGGTSLYDREIRLVLLRPDFRTAQQIQNRINTRFQSPDDPWVAQARREYVLLRVPERYRDRYDHFIDLVWALYLRSTPGYIETQLRGLNKSAAEPGADYGAIALAWEAIGKSALPFLENWYRDPTQGEVAYHAARTALALEDHRAVEALTYIALQDGHPCQLQAASTLNSVSKDPQVRMTLHRLLAHDNYRIRILAYEGLRRIKDASVSCYVEASGFRLDVVRAPGRPIVSVWATKEPRLALFGEEVALPKDLFYCTADEAITLNARPDDELVTVTRRLPGSKRLVTGTCSRSLADLIHLLASPNPDHAQTVPGMSFSQITGLVHDLCDKAIIDAHFQLHRLPDDLVQ